MSTEIQINETDRATQVDFRQLTEGELVFVGGGDCTDGVGDGYGGGDTGGMGGSDTGGEG